MNQQGIESSGMSQEKSLEVRIVEAASDYKMGLRNQGFADEFGGVDKLRNDLFALVEEWEGEVEDSED